MKGRPSTSWKAGIAKQWIHKTKSIHLQYVPYTTITPLAKPKIIAKVCLNRKGILKEKRAPFDPFRLMNHNCQYPAQPVRQKGSP
jgi:hypothetical protein